MVVGQTAAVPAAPVPWDRSGFPSHAWSPVSPRDKAPDF